MAPNYLTAPGVFCRVSTSFTDMFQFHFKCFNETSVPYNMNIIDYDQITLNENLQN